jgi:hypothetical protein
MAEHTRVNYFYLWESREAMQLVLRLDSSRMGVERKYLLGLSKSRYPQPAYFTVLLNEQGIDKNLPKDLLGFLKNQGFDYLAVAFWNEGLWAGRKWFEGIPKKLLKRFSPGKTITSDMADDLRRPFLTLWNQKRPGPVVEIYRIDWKENE